MSEQPSKIYAGELLNVPSSLGILLVNDVRAKTDNLHFSVGAASFKFPVTNNSIQQLSRYRESLASWAKDPINPPQGIEGHVAALMLTLVLQQVLSPNPELIVRPTPATMDFLDSSSINEWGPSTDILVGRWEREAIEPLFLLAISIANEGKTVIHRKLGVPVLKVAGEKIYGDRIAHDVMQFGLSNNPKAYIEQLSEISRGRLLKTIKHKLGSEAWDRFNLLPNPPQS